MELAFLAHPAMPTLLFTVLAIPALWRLYARVGLRPWPAMLLIASFVVPFLGLMLALLPLAVRPWPNFPKAPEKPKPVKLPI